MAGRKPSPEKQKAFVLFLDSNGEMPLIEIAEKVGKSDSQIRKWKSTDKWDEQLEERQKGNVTKSKSNVTKSDVPEKSAPAPPNNASKGSGTTRKGRGSKQTKRNKGGQPGNDNAVGHGAPDGNTNAVTHGFYRSLLPARLQKIAEQMEGRDVLEMLREQITVLSSIIYDSLQQLYVEDMNDHRDFVTKEKAVSGAFLGGKTEDGTEVLGEVEREWHTAWDRQSKALQAYERQVGRFQSLVKTYLQLSDESDFFRLRIEKMEQDIELDRQRFEHQKEMDEARLDLALYKALPPQDEDAEPTEPDGYTEAMGGMTAQEVWSDDPATES